MSRARLTLSLAVASVLLAACGAPQIKGTEIEDTPDNRAILQLIDRYQAAFEKRDSAALLALASARYIEDGGTTQTDDDYDYDGLQKRLEGEDFARVLKARLSIQVNGVTVEGDRAWADVRIETRYQTRPLREDKEPEWHLHADDNRLHFVREGGEWKIFSGM